jgi:hypothetical protein
MSKVFARAGSAILVLRALSAVFSVPAGGTAALFSGFTVTGTHLAPIDEMSSGSCPDQQ